MRSHDVGRSAEARFIADASDLGYLVCRPFGEAPGYDALVDTGFSLVKVQIKGASVSARRTGDAYWKININRKPERRRPIRFDILAVYIAGANQWLFFHYAEVAHRRQIGFGPGGRWMRDAHSWEIFRQMPLHTIKRFTPATKRSRR